MPFNGHSYRNFENSPPPHQNNNNDLFEFPLNDLSNSTNPYSSIVNSKFADQDALLDTLGSNITKLKQYAIDTRINIEDTTKSIENINEDTTNTTQRIDSTNKIMKYKVMVKNNCGFIICIILLILLFVITIVIMQIIPKN